MTIIRRNRRVAPRRALAQPRRVDLPLLALVALALAARLLLLGHQGLWLDESFTALAARVVNAKGPLHVMDVDHIAPGYYWLAALFARVGGYSAWVLRLPSALAGGFAVWGTHRLAEAVTRDRAAALTAALAVAVGPFAVAYGQEARGYDVMLALASFYLLWNWEALEFGLTWPRAVRIGLVAAALLWFHHAALFLFFGQGLLVLWSRRLRRFTWAWLAVHLVALATFVPWLVITWTRLTEDSEAAGQAVLARLPYNLLTMVAGPAFGPSNREIRQDGAVTALLAHWPDLLLLAVAFALACWSLWSSGFSRSLREESRREGRHVVAWFVAVLGGANLALLAAVYATHILYHVRYVATIYPAFAVLVGIALRPSKQLVVRLATVATCAVWIWSLVNYYLVADYSKEDFRQVPATLRAMGPEDVLLIANSNALPPMEAYGFTCPTRAETLRTAEGLPTLSGLAVDHAPGAETWTVETRMWEISSAADVDARLDKLLGAPIRTWSWNGTTVTVRRGALQPGTGNGFYTGCKNPY